MKCPHCLVEFHDRQSSMPIGIDKDGGWMLLQCTCPACGRFVLTLLGGRPIQDEVKRLRYVEAPITSRLIRPQGVSRAPVPPEVPPEIAEDYKEACLVLGDSPKASAALSRRCLQALLRSVGGVKDADLNSEIQQVLDGKTLPSPLADSIDAVRVIGNFAAHPIKSKSTGEVVPVEPHEAGWNLDVLESLFDFYFVLPARIRAKREALNKKTGDAGKPPLK